MYDGGGEDLCGFEMVCLEAEKGVFWLLNAFGNEGMKIREMSDKHVVKTTEKRAASERA